MGRNLNPWPLPPEQTATPGRPGTKSTTNESSMLSVYQQSLVEVMPSGTNSGKLTDMYSAGRQRLVRGSDHIYLPGMVMFREQVIFISAFHFLPLIPSRASIGSRDSLFSVIWAVLGTDIRCPRTSSKFVHLSLTKLVSSPNHIRAI